jgi:ADP-heptose:LPS heptosyltransferase
MAKIEPLGFLKSAFLFFKILLTYIFDTFVFYVVKKSPLSRDLAIVRMDAIGDFILWLDAAKEFRHLYPDKKITLIANRAWSDLAELLPYWDDIIPVEIKKFLKNPRYRFNILKVIRRAGFKLIIQPTFSREFRVGDSVIRASGAATRIGSVGDLSNITLNQKKISDQWYTQLIPAIPKPLMELKRNAEFIRGLGMRQFVSSIPKLPKTSALPASLVLKSRYFVLSPGASWPGRMWPLERFAAILAEFHEKNGWKAVLCGSSQEKKLCREVIDKASVDALNLAGETSLPELVEVIRNAELVVANETSFVHIAAAVGTPSVCILGGGHYGRFMPYDIEKDTNKQQPLPIIHKMDCFNCNWRCRYVVKKKSAVPCIEKITVNEVYESIKLLLDKQCLSDFVQ